jgi:hypothetical protein
MNSTKFTLLAAASALAMPTMAPAAQAAPVQARSYAQLLEPIPNAVERLRASDNELTVRAYLTPAQHYRHRYRRWWHGRWVFYYGYSPWVAPPVYYGYGYPYGYDHHHHHHHHHHNHHHHNHW